MLWSKWRSIQVIPFMIMTIMLGVLMRKVMYVITAMQLYQCMWNTNVLILYVDHSGRPSSWTFVNGHLLHCYI